MTNVSKDMISLLVVYKSVDEDIVKHLKILIETDDDKENYEIVGTEDGTVKVMRCTEEAWLANRKAGRENMLADKVIFIGDIKGTENPAYQFKMHGISYGKINDNYMKINVDEKYIWSRDEYSVFISELKAIADNSVNVEVDQDKKPKTKLAMLVGGFLFPPLHVYNAITLAIDAQDARNDAKLMRKQMLLYGITKMYYNDLEEFVKR